MATRRTGTQSRATGAGVKPKDKGTRGGRPEAQPVSNQGKGGGSRSASGQRRPSSATRQAGNGHSRPVRPAQANRPAPDAADAAATVAETPRAPLWFQLTTWGLSLAGLGVSIWLTITHFVGTQLLICPDKGFINCAAVTSSPESELFGIFPVAVLGLAFYVFLAVANSPWAWRARWPLLNLARLGSMVVGMLFVLYLVYTELITLGEICLWCTSVHVITFVLFAFTMFSVAAGFGAVKLPAKR